MIETSWKSNSDELPQFSEGAQESKAQLLLSSACDCLSAPLAKKNRCIELGSVQRNAKVQRNDILLDLEMLQNAYFVAKIGAETAATEANVFKLLTTFASN